MRVDRGREVRAAARAGRRRAGPRDRRKKAPVAPERRRWSRRSRAWSGRAGPRSSACRAGFGRAAAAGVEHDPYRLAALGLVAARDQLAAPRRRRPADVAQVVAFEILAKALEVAAQAALARAAKLQIDLAAAREKNLLILALAQRRIDAHRSARAAPSPSAPPARAAKHSEGKPLRLVHVAAFARLDFVTQRCAGTRGRRADFAWQARRPARRAGRRRCGTQESSPPLCSTASSISVSLSSAGALLHERSIVISCGVGNRNPSRMTARSTSASHASMPYPQVARAKESRQREHQPRGQQPDGSRREAKREAAARPASGSHWLRME
jgi:hypothetical protein